MSLREDMWKYEQITGESAEHVPIIKLGAFLDGYDMAIKALEQQTCEDCISREAVEKITWEEPSYDDALNVLTEVRDKVRALPSVTPKQTRWIPVSEKDYIPKNILDKIRAEIENHCGLTKENHCRYCSYCNNLMGVREILEIIDKYKAESEG